MASLARDSVLRGVLKYRADAGPVALVIAVSALALVPFAVALPIWATVSIWAVVFYVRTFCAFAQHNHAHFATFNWAPLNRLYDLLLAQNTGYPSALWELHHNRGHHRHYLDPERDVAAIIYPGTTRVMSRAMYALRGNLLIHRDAIRIGLAEGRAGKRTLLPKLAIETALQILVAGLLLSWNWPLALAFVIVPNFMSAYLIWWQSYPHHHAMPCTNPYDGSMTVESPGYNRVTFNIGHHTAHHEKPTLHWSLLPARTAQIRDRIHPDCFRDAHATVGNGVLQTLGTNVKQFFSRERLAKTADADSRDHAASAPLPTLEP